MIKEDEIKKTKINKLMQTLPKGLVLLSSWLVSEGYSYELQQRYRTSGWLKSIGKGAMVRSKDSLVLSGAISALQIQANLNIHVGGRSALEQLGLAHYLQVNSQETILFVNGKSSLPLWFTSNQWDTKVKLFRTSLFRDDTIGLMDYQDGELTMKISNAARAMMECLSLCPTQFPLTEAYELMEELTSLRPAQVQTLLEQCKSVKTKRLFLYFAERANHAWFKYLDVDKIDLGSGVRSFVENGTFVFKYQIVLPQELMI
ncbi:MAG: type IV toxin-antitoxin system AbiEi family antitoxin [Candidatus Symbiothrix sp.]|jgi:hypothetical protein|nr:type IV toxin-antitoxin system AbiEi family antitoxin [Candidatus Symbiothrix sp.]